MALFKEEALRPQAFNVRAFIKDEVAEEKGLTDEERILAAGATSEFWITLKKYINDLMLQVDEAHAEYIDSGESFEKIGEQTKVIVTVKGILKDIFSKVDNAREAIERANGTRE